MNNDNIKKDFLKEIHDDILNKGFITLSVSLVLIIFMVITIEDRLFFDIIRFVLFFICSIVMITIDVKYKTCRTEKQNKIISRNALLFIALTMTAALNIIRLIY
ncbi:hypothetical protein IZY60_04430 [Lutibacter sp. B2]|nr:hypothetical protein [Lutibacter sp. B2]